MSLHHFIIIALMTSSVWLHGFLSVFAWCQSATVYTQHALFVPHYLLPPGTGTNHAYSYFTTYYSDLIFVTQWAVLPIIADLTTSVQTHVLHNRWHSHCKKMHILIEGNQHSHSRSASSAFVLVTIATSHSRS